MRPILQNRILIALAVLLAVVAVRYGSSMLMSRTSAPVPEWPAIGQDAPSAENVSHDYRRRVAELQGRIETAPDDTLALRELAGMQFDAHSMEAAAALYERYLVLVPGARQAWLDLATAQASLERWNDAEQTMLRMLDLFPDDPAGTWNLGAVLANQGRPEEAATWWHRTMESADTALAAQARRALASLTRP